MTTEKIIVARPAVRRLAPIRRRDGFPQVFDNGGKTADRFAIVLENGDLLAASADPFHPCGIGMHCGNICKEHLGGFSTAQQFVDEAVADPNWLGQRVHDLSTLPTAVQEFIRQSR